MYNVRMYQFPLFQIRLDLELPDLRTETPPEPEPRPDLQRINSNLFLDHRIRHKMKHLASIMLSAAIKKTAQFIITITECITVALTLIKIATAPKH